ncbi:unnamed protein product [Menidia menidia]|uniref:(Atlantic silverside) hypothetical protein n=1 Tax=Menidia menidia TaxID=238744 RepID=A0A8S4C0G5_9TELE|nr:unnamed protein product [Menidia menidia]
MFKAAFPSILCLPLIVDVPCKVQPESCESKEPKPEAVSLNHETREQTTDQLEQKQLNKEPNAKSATDSKLPLKPKSRTTGHKRRAKNHHVSIFRTENKAPQNRKVTDYFPIRRSNRKTKTELKV